MRSSERRLLHFVVLELRLHLVRLLALGSEVLHSHWRRLGEYCIANDYLGASIPCFSHTSLVQALLLLLPFPFELFLLLSPSRLLLLPLSLQLLMPLPLQLLLSL